ncbi:MAG: hypothetical protein ACO3A2_02330 [Bdellovibrionia bacterium]
MRLDSDIALVGTGVAPLIAAHHLFIQGKSVLLLNPDLDFFLEDSELPLDPMLLKLPDPRRLERSHPERCIQLLRPDFPGAIELWSADAETKEGKKTGFHDPDAPHVRKRGRLWVASSSEKTQGWSWEGLEELYVKASDEGLDPQISPTFLRRFPGLGSTPNESRTLYLPKVCDVDVSRYRNGLLEFVRERLSSQRVLCDVHQIERIPDGIRFYLDGSPHTAKLNEGMLVFWTPRLSNWILAQCKQLERKPPLPNGVQRWEQWFINSRDPLDPSIVGMFADMAVWAEFEGSPPPLSLATQKDPNPKLLTLSVLRNAGTQRDSWVSSESFAALSQLCRGFLRWDRFSVRSLKVRELLDWSNPAPWLLSPNDPPIWIVPQSDGPLTDVVEAARAACELKWSPSHAQGIGR